MNLPKFYIGQRVVALKTIMNNFGKGFKNGVAYNVRRLRKAPCPCGNWQIDIGLVAHSDTTACANCGAERPCDGALWCNSKYFTPLQEQTAPLIKLSQIQEKEKEKADPLILIEN